MGGCSCLRSSFLPVLPVLKPRDTPCTPTCRDELEHWKEKDTLSHLYLSFSRDESCKYKHCQDQFQGCGAELIKSVALSWTNNAHSITRTVYQT